MKRKILFSLIITLTLLCGIFSPSMVSAAKDYSSYHWSVQDIMDLHEGTLEAWSRPECQMAEPFDPMQDTCMNLVVQLYSIPFSITSINPSKSTIKIFYINELGYKATNVKFHLFWSTSNERAEILVNQPDLYTDLFYGETYDFETDPIKPYQEIEIPISHGELLSQEPYSIYFFIEFNGMLGAPIYGAQSYSDCITKLGYQPGMECSVRYNDYMDAVFLPTGTPDSNDAQDTNDDTQNETNNGLGLGETNSSPNTTSDIWAEKEGTSETVASVTAKTPETGINTSEDDGVIELPWWLGIIFMLGITTLGWLFWPKGKKSKKSR